MKRRLFHRGRREKRRPTKLFYAILAWGAVACTVFTLGAVRIIRVNRGVLLSAENAAAALYSQEDLIVSFSLANDSSVPAAVRLSGRAPSTGDAIATMTWEGAKQRTIAVFEGTAAEDLERGAGRTPNTAMPNAPGRCVLHGHRDSVFSFLRYARQGDMLTLSTPESTIKYTVTDSFVASPDDEAIYAQSEGVELALVTCYPFSFVGPAPERFVVLAEPVPSQ